jgi:hypothetical protein
MDCDCLTAVLGASGFAPKPTVHLVLSRRMFTFNLETACGHKSTAFRDFLLQHPEYKDGYIAFYRIPLDTLRRYPGLFEKRELLAPSNVALVKNDDESKYHIGSSALDYIMIQYSLWSQFFANNKTPTKTAVLQMASQIVTVRQ